LDDDTESEVIADRWVQRVEERDPYLGGAEGESWNRHESVGQG
jgi:hypothetical protein